MTKKVSKASKTPASKVIPQGATSVGAIDNVKKNFDGLHGEIEKLPAGAQKTMISRYAADAYLATTKTIFELGNVVNFRGLPA